MLLKRQRGWFRGVQSPARSIQQWTLPDKEIGNLFACQQPPRADACARWCAGFELKDALALIRMDNLYIETFEIKDVKVLHLLHASPAAAAC